MATKQASKKKVPVGKIALASAAAVAAGAAAYYFSDTDRRKKAKAWMGKMKQETVKRLKGMKKMSREMYHEAIDKVADKYKNIKQASPAEVAALVADLKKHWSQINKGGAKIGTKKSAAKKKSAARKTTTRSSKK